MSRHRLPGRAVCKALSPRQLAALLFLADCPHNWYSWVDAYKKRPVEFHGSTLRSLNNRKLMAVLIDFEPYEGAARRCTVELTPGGRALIAAYRYGYDAGIEAE